MLPEMAASYAVGMIPTAALTGLHLYLYRRKMHLPKVTIIQRNLAKENLYWAESQGSLRLLNETSLLRDRSRYQRSVFLLGGLCLFLSWLGFLVQLLVMVSLRYLAVSRFEQRLFTSKLAELELSAEEIKTELKELRELYPQSFPQN